MTQRIPESFTVPDWSLVTISESSLPPRDPDDDNDEDEDEDEDQREPPVVREPDEDE